MGYAAVRTVDRSLIPVIDIGPLRDGSDPRGVGEALHRASRDVGFIYVANHGIDEALIADAREAALAFFRLPEATKLATRITAKHRGFLKVGAARMQDDARHDLKESFIWGYEDAAGATPDDHALRGPNLWPEAAPDLRRHGRAWFAAADGLARLLLEGFALGIGRQRDLFLGRGGAPLSRASYTWYPPQPADMGPDQFGVAPHTDFGVLTVLAQDEVGGLQVQDAAGDWVAAPPIPGTLVVNVGDLLARWTAGRYRSTPHRVVNSSGRERLSLVLAFDPEPETVIDARTVLPADAPELAQAAEPITCGDYLVWRFARSFAYRKPDTAA